MPATAASPEQKQSDRPKRKGPVRANGEVAPREISFRLPTVDDGVAVRRLIASCEPLDENSLYCNLLQCDHLRDTCIVAERKHDDGIVGWVSGYLMPGEPRTLFVWQVAVHDSAKGQGIASKMLKRLLERDVCADVRALKTTVTPGNAASWALFRSFARRQGGDLTSEPYFLSEQHFDGAHDTEHLVTISLPERRADSGA